MQDQKNKRINKNEYLKHKLIVWRISPFMWPKKNHTARSPFYPQLDPEHRAKWASWILNWSCSPPLPHSSMSIEPHSVFIMHLWLHTCSPCRLHRKVCRWHDSCGTHFWREWICIQRWGLEAGKLRLRGQFDALNTRKSDELVTDFRKHGKKLSPLHTGDECVQRLQDFKFLGIHTCNNLTCSITVTAALTTAQQWRAGYWTSVPFRYQSNGAETVAYWRTGVIRCLILTPSNGITIALLLKGTVAQLRSSRPDTTRQNQFQSSPCPQHMYQTQGPDDAVLTTQCGLTGGGQPGASKRFQKILQKVEHFLSKLFCHNLWFF